MAVVTSLQNWFSLPLSYIKDPHNRRFLGMVVGGLVVLGGALYGYSWYSTYKEKQAQQIFDDCFQEYEYAQAGHAQWARVEQLCKVGYQKHSSSHLAPYMLAMEGEALLKQNKKDEALAVFGTMMSVLPTSSPVYAYHATKYALVQIDTADENIHQKGVALLTTLAQDTTNSACDMALYYLGLYYWSVNNTESAKKEWLELMKLQEQGQGAPSPWAMLAQDKLRNIL